MKSRRTWWFLFSGGALLVVAALGWITFLVLRMEAEAQHAASVRLALWRMDSWLGPRLGREELRPYFEYLPFYAQQRAYTRVLNEIEPGEVITPSSLLTFQSDLFPLHFQVGADGSITSPQVPTGNWRDLAEGGGERPYVTAADIEQHQPLLARVQVALGGGPVQIEGCVSEAEGLLARVMGDDRTQRNQALTLTEFPYQQAQQQDLSQTLEALLPPPPQQVQEWASGKQRADVQNKISKADMAKRAQKGYSQEEVAANAAQPQQAQVMIMPQQGAAITNVESVDVGELVPVWMTAKEDGGHGGGAQSPTTPTLLFLRRVHIGTSTIYQGMLCDWPVLHASLLQQINDLFPRATLTPEANPTPAMMESGRMLGTAPVTLDAPCPSIAAGPMITPARTTLSLAWLAVLGAIFAAGITLRSSIAYGEKRSRFASAVTHELRTPLTTFRMYSEMLAEGMVSEEDQRREYLRTLQQESCRLATLVENVLAYARLEEGRSARHVQRMSVADLLSRVRDVLKRRTDDGGMELVLRDRAPADAMLLVDPDAVGQILFNLVDNACKYANGSADRRIEIDTRLEHDRLSMTVRDHGPGISPQHQHAIFRAFDRGAHGPGDTIPGVGLGLALARGLARDMGGDLTLQTVAHGACFMVVLSQPRV